MVEVVSAFIVVKIPISGRNFGLAWTVRTST